MDMKVHVIQSYCLCCRLNVCVLLFTSYIHYTETLKCFFFLHLVERKYVIDILEQLIYQKEKPQKNCVHIYMVGYVVHVNCKHFFFFYINKLRNLFFHQIYHYNTHPVSFKRFILFCLKQNSQWHRKIAQYLRWWYIYLVQAPCAAMHA